MNLSRRGLYVVSMVIVLTIIGTWTTSAWVTMLAQYGAVLLVLLGFYEWLDSRRELEKLELTLPQNLTLGNGASCQVRLDNGRHRVAQFELAVQVPTSVRLSPAEFMMRVPARAVGCQVLSVVGINLGEVAISQARVRVEGRFGLAHWSKTLFLDSVSKVIPDVLRGTLALPGQTQGGEVGQLKQGAGGEFLSLRPYAIGDPIRAIDWKATARAGEPIVRQFSQDQHLEIMVVIDAGRSANVRVGPLTRLGQFTNVACRLAEMAVGADDRVGLMVFADQVIYNQPPARGLESLQRFRTALAELRVGAVESNPMVAIAPLLAQLRQRTLVVLLTELADADHSGLIKSVALLRPRHLPLIASVRDAGVDDLVDQPGDSWLAPYLSVAASDSLEREAQTLADLDQLGCFAVNATPETLDQAVLGRYQFLRQRRLV